MRWIVGTLVFWCVYVAGRAVAVSMGYAVDATVGDALGIGIPVLIAVHAADVIWDGDR